MSFAEVVVSKIITGAVKRKFKIDSNIMIDDLEITDAVDDRVCFNVSATIDVPKKDIIKLVGGAFNEKEK